jgi:hypothetical protein
VFCSDISALKALGKHWVTYFSPDSSPEYIAALIIDRLNADFAFNLRLRVKINFSWERIYNDYIKPLLVE